MGTISYNLPTIGIVKNVEKKMQHNNGRQVEWANIPYEKVATKNRKLRGKA